MENNFSDRMIKQLLNSVFTKYGGLSVASRSIICRSQRLRQIIDLQDTDKSQHFAQPRPIIKLLIIPSSVKGTCSSRDGTYWRWGTSKLVQDLRMC